jgi:hypothetical protein
VPPHAVNLFIWGIFSAVEDEIPEAMNATDMPKYCQIYADARDPNIVESTQRLAELNAELNSLLLLKDVQRHNRARMTEINEGLANCEEEMATVKAVALLVSLWKKKARMGW